MINEPLHTVIETPTFVADAKRLLDDAERSTLVSAIAADPTKGDLIPGAGGVRKLRWARKGAGKRGGYRIVYYHHSEDIPVFLFGIFAKNERVDLSQAERNAIAKSIPLLVEEYRHTARQTKEGRNVQSRRKTTRRR